MQNCQEIRDQKRALADDTRRAIKSALTDHGNHCVTGDDVAELYIERKAKRLHRPEEQHA